MTDVDFWKNLKWPAAPNKEDVAIFSEYCYGKVLLLGSTKLLLPLAMEAYDIEPLYEDDKIKKRDWFSIDKHWDTIIIDGGFALGKELTDQLLPIVLNNCDRFVARVFLNPNWKTKYACYFPKRHELTPVPEEHPINNIYTFYIWNKNQQF